MKTKIAVHWQYGAVTHNGWFRTANEDRSVLRVGHTPAGQPFAAAAMADGLGGLDDGEAASELAIGRVKDWLDNRLPVVLGGLHPWRALQREAAALLQSIHAELLQIGTQRGQRLGTTLTLLVLTGSVYMAAHIGDCRIYRMPPAGGIRRLTRDHTAAGLRNGLASLVRRAAGKQPPGGHVLARFLGMRGALPVDVRLGQYGPKTLFLLTSDGFHGLYPTDARLEGGLRRLLRDGSDMQELCDTLLFKALEKRPKDNVSLIALRAMHTGPADAELVKTYIRLLPLNWSWWRRRWTDWWAGWR